MADRYVKNTGSNTSPYDTWAKAATTIATAVTGSAAGDTIYVSSAHVRTGLSAQSITVPGTASNPLKIISVNDSAAPPTATAVGASEATAALAAYSLGQFVYGYGISIIAGTPATNSASINLSTANTAQASVFESCSFSLDNIGVNSRIALSQNNLIASSRMEFKDCTFVFGGNATHGFLLAGRTNLSGGSVSGPTSYTTGIFQGQVSGRHSFADIEGLDISGVGASTNLVASSESMMVIRLSNLKLPASWTGELFTGTRYSGQRVSLYNSDNADTNYRLWIEDYAGSIRDETTIVRTGGASDGTTPISWKMVTNANSNNLTVPLRSDPIAIWNDTVGTPITVTLEMVNDGLTLTDADAWIDVDYLGTSGFPLGASISDKRATVLTTPANQASSSETWATTGLTTPVKQKLSVTVTPREVGFIYASVRLAKPSTTVYVCPKITVT